MLHLALLLDENEIECVAQGRSYRAECSLEVLFNHIPTLFVKAAQWGNAAMSTGIRFLLHKHRHPGQRHGLVFDRHDHHDTDAQTCVTQASQTNAPGMTLPCHHAFANVHSCIGSAVVHSSPKFLYFKRRSVDGVSPPPRLSLTAHRSHYVPSLFLFGIQYLRW